jgi:DNA-binding GntR family transcriptional regulator
MPIASPVSHGNLRTRVYTQLRDQILRGTYTRGTALTEISISQELGVSRTPVREAFSQLELDGLVKATPNKGVVVEGFDQQDILDWYDIRLNLEGMAVEKATARMTPELASQLSQTIEEASLKLSESETEALMVLDSRFHSLVFQASASRVLQNFQNPITHYTRQSRLVSLANPMRASEVIHEHTLILEAMIVGDGRTARQRMEQHIRHAADSYRRVLRQDPIATSDPA